MSYLKFIFKEDDPDEGSLARALYQEWDFFYGKGRDEGLIIEGAEDIDLLAPLVTLGVLSIEWRDAQHGEMYYVTPFGKAYCVFVQSGAAKEGSELAIYVPFWED